ncbi:MAG: hypothetical protein H8F28_22955 [Fibrella sp.]|nr:hypothetical protein [Armatimonadota bacterium]
MSDGGKLVVGFLLVIVALWILGQIFAATIGYFILALIIGVIIALIVALVRVSLRANASPKSPLGDKADRIAEQKLKQVERKMEAERLKH